MMPPMPAGALPRRDVLGMALLAAGGLALTGCGIRLESDAPRVPLLPTRTPGPDEVALGDARARLLRLQASLTGDASPAATTAIRLHTEQLAVITAALSQLGAPAATASATASGTSSAAGTGTSTGAGTGTAATSSISTASDADAARLEEQAATTTAAALATATSAYLPMLTSLTAAHHRIAQLFGAPALPVPTPPAFDEASTLLRTVAAARYGLEVAVVRARGHRDAIETARRSVEGWLRGLTLAAAGSGVGADAGYALPFAVTDDASATRLAAHLLSTVTTGAGRAFAGAEHDPTLASYLTRLTVESDRLATGFGSPVSAFPGLTRA